jgi:hypothetical protein
LDSFGAIGDGDLSILTLVRATSRPATTGEAGGLIRCHRAKWLSPEKKKEHDAPEPPPQDPEPAFQILQFVALPPADDPDKPWPSGAEHSL